MECRKIQQKRWFQNIGFKVVKVMFRGGVCKLKGFTILSEFLPFFSIQCILVKYLFRDWSLSIFFVSSGLFSTLKRGLAFPLISAGAINSGSILSSFFWYRRQPSVISSMCDIHCIPLFYWQIDNLSWIISVFFGVYGLSADLLSKEGQPLSYTQVSTSKTSLWTLFL